MTRKDELLAAFDDALSHEWESIEYAIKDLTDEEAAYQHPAYRDEPPEDGHPPAGTALWHLVHLQNCYDYYNIGIQSRPNKAEEVWTAGASTVAEAIANLMKSRATLRSTVAELTESQLDDKLGSGRTVIELVRASIRHDAWHAGQIMVARRLWRTRLDINS